MGLKKYLILTHDLQERKVVGGALCGFLSWIRKLFTPLFLLFAFLFMCSFGVLLLCFAFAISY